MQLYLCEKPSQAKDIAKVLGCNERGNGSYTGNGMVVTWCVGHLLEQANPEDYDSNLKQWSLDTLPMLPPVWTMNVKASAKKQFSIIKKLLSKAQEVVISTDADREGEVIAREILELVGFTGSIKRLWLSALDEASVRKALANIKPGAETEGLYYAGLGRSRADWLLGLNMTRLCTVLGRSLGYQQALSVGRVQSPTLRLVVERDRLIERFSPVPFFDVKASFSDGGQSKAFTAKWTTPEDVADETGRCLQRPIAQGVATQCANQVATVTKFETKRQKVKHPLPYFLGSLQKAMSAKYGYSAQKVLDTAQSLYEKHKVTSYPRTDCGYLPVSQLSEVAEVLKALGQADALSTWCHGSDLTLKSACWNDKKITAHHAMIPKAVTPNLSAMSEMERNVYLAITSRYIAQFYPVAEDDATVIHLSVGQHRFRTAGKVERVKGWRAVIGKESDTDSKEGDDSSSQSLPSMVEGQQLQCTKAALEDKKTKPPSRYTEGTLIDAMSSVAKLVDDPRLKAVLKETAGIGTEATRAGILETLKNREYLVPKGKQLISSQAGRALIDALPDAVTNPAMTAMWEQALDKIASGDYQLDEFMVKQTRFITDLVNQFKSGQRSLNLPTITKPSAPCPLCKKTMKFISTKKTKFWACENKTSCGLLLDDSRGSPVNTAPCRCKKGVLVRKKAKAKGKFWWGCSAYKSGCKQRHFDEKGKLGKSMPAATA